MKTAGRERGRRCIVIDLMDKNFVLVTGPPKVTGIKRRRVNIKHLQKTEEKVDVKKGATDEEVSQALTKTKPASKKSKTA